MAHRHLAQIAIVASQADVFVLGGDIFDFRWSSLPTAGRWAGRPSGSRRCSVLVARLPVPSGAGQPRLPPDVHRPAGAAGAAGPQPGLASLLHPAGQQHLPPRRRGRPEDERPDAGRGPRRMARRPARGPFLSRLYDVVVLTRLHKPVPHLVYARRIVVRRIFQYLESIGEGPGQRRCATSISGIPISGCRTTATAGWCSTTAAPRSRA